MSEYKDGLYYDYELKSAFGEDFDSEKDLSDYIEKNIDFFTRDCLGLEYKSHQREYSLSFTRKRTIKGNRRVDFMIETKCGKKIGIECKNPTYQSELMAALGQCLAYITLFEANEKPLSSIFIVSTKIDSVLPMVLSKFKLPIGFMCFDKSKYAILNV